MPEPAASTGYSGTPLAKKLGIKEGSRVLLLGAPAEYLALVDPLPANIVFHTVAGQETDLVHIFTVRRAELTRYLTDLRRLLRPDAVIWVSWPKRAARVATEVNEDVVREVALPLGFVDIKICAVSDVWSGLKLMVRRTLR